MSRQSLELAGSSDLLQARLSARTLAQRAGLGVMDQTRFATAVSELCRNALTYAGEGWCHLTDLSDREQVVLQAEVEDRGPGIADLTLAMTDGFSTSGSLGAGLPGARRLVDDFRINSTTGGTVVLVRIIRRRHAA